VKGKETKTGLPPPNRERERGQGRAGLVMELEAGVDALRPELAVMEVERRPWRAPRTARTHRRRHQVRVHPAVDLAARTEHVVPVQERVAEVDPYRLRQLHADLEADLRRVGDLVAREGAGVGRQGE